MVPSLPPFVSPAHFIAAHSAPLMIYRLSVGSSGVLFLYNPTPGLPYQAELDSASCFHALALSGGHLVRDPLRTLLLISSYVVCYCTEKLSLVLVLRGHSYETELKDLSGVSLASVN